MAQPTPIASAVTVATIPGLSTQDHSQRPPIKELPEKHFRRNVVAIIVDERQRLLLCLRKDREGWQCVQGGVEAKDDDLVRTAARELYEEVGLHAFHSDGTNRILSDADLGLAEAVEHVDRRAPRTEDKGVPTTLRYVGKLPLLPDEAPLRHWFPAGTARTLASRGIYGQQQAALLFATNNGGTLVGMTDLSGLLGQKQEFIGLAWHTIVADPTALLACVPPCKVDVFRTLHVALRRIFAAAVGDETSLTEGSTIAAEEAAFTAEVRCVAKAYLLATR